MRWRRDEFVICDERSAVDVELVAKWLAQTHWGYRRPPAVVARLVEHSLCFSLLLGDRYIGFARVVTDRTVFSWLSDLVVYTEFRGRSLYEKFGFVYCAPFGDYGEDPFSTFMTLEFS
jgi:hypothetical protein